MQIPKFQNPAKPLYPWKPSEQQEAVNKFVDSKLNEVKQIVKTADKRNSRLREADKRANRNVKIPQKLNNTAKLQEALYNVGAYNDMRNRKGISLSYEQAVDGIHGKMTDSAIAKAREMGYDVDVAKGTVTKRQENKSSNTSRQKSTKSTIPTFTTSTGNVYDPDTRILKFSPLTQYFKDIIHNMTSKEGSPDIVLTNNDFSQSYNEDASRLAQIAYRQYVREHGYPKPGQKISLPINPSVYKEINEDGKYANFTLHNIIKSAIGGDNQVEFTDGGTSGTAVINPKTGNLDVTFTDRTAWDDAPSGTGIGSRIRQIMEKIGSSGKDNKGDYVQRLKYSIPGDTLTGDYKGKLRSIPHYYE